MPKASNNGINISMSRRIVKCFSYYKCVIKEIFCNECHNLH